MKIILLSLFTIISFIGISQSACTVVLDSNTIVLKSDTIIDTCSTQFDYDDNYLVCPGVSVNFGAKCFNQFYLENNATLILDSIPGTYHYPNVGVKSNSIYDINYIGQTYFYEPGAILIDSFFSTSVTQCSRIIYDYSNLPGGVSGCGTSTGINKIKLSKFSFEVYPNPANEFINIKTNLDNYTLKLFNTIGKLVWMGTSKRIEIIYPKGVYFLKIENETNSLTKKVVIN